MGQCEGKSRRENNVIQGPLVRRPKNPDGPVLMTQEDIKGIIRDVLSEQGVIHKETMDNAMVKTVAAILTSFGIEEEDRKEIRADFLHLRKWRKSVEQTQSLTFKAIVAVLVSGFLGVVWLGFKTMVGK